MKRPSKTIHLSALLGILGFTLLLPAQTAAPSQSSPTRMTPAFLRGSAWKRLRTAMPAIMAGNGRSTGFESWNIAASLDGFRQTTFFDALEKSDPFFVNNVEAASTQKVSAEIPKDLDFRLSPGELSAVKAKLAATKQRLIALDVPAISPDEADIRRLFQFAKELNVSTIVSEPAPEALAALDRAANEFRINFAVLGHGAYADPRNLLKALQGLSKRVGACVDTAIWMEQGIQVEDGLKTLNDRVIAVHLLDRSSRGKNGRNVTLGTGAARIAELLSGMAGMAPGIAPAFITVEYTGTGDVVADMSRSFDALDKALQPVAADRVDQLSKITPIRGPERLRETDRLAIEAAVPARAQTSPRKPRRLLVIDLNVAYPGHGSIPAANLAIGLWGKTTGAYTAVFDNNLDNLKYPKIREFDAIFLNNTVGQVFPDPRVRVGLMRFVREGGGLGGYHGMPHASQDWPEFGDMLAARGGQHRDPQERVTIRIEDKTSPLTAMFEGKEFEWRDEFFRFTSPPWSRDKVHVLLSFDTLKTDLHQKPDCEICNRDDDDYPVSWIRSYGKGRIFYTTVGHLPALFESPVMARFLLAGIQFILGDLDTDTTPGTK